MIDIKQGSDEWLSLRDKYIKTASRTPIVMGLSPFSNKEKLAKEIKFGIKPYMSEAMMRGVDLEDTVRKKANDILDDIFVPKVGVNDGYLASLDGINFDGDTIIEIKVSKDTFDEVSKGKIPKHYEAQIQHQLMVFDSVKKAFLIAYDHEKEEVALSEPIYPDKEFKPKIEPLWDDFITFMSEYELKEEYIKRDDLEFEMVAKRYIEIISDIKRLLKEKQEYQQILLELSGGNKTKGFGVTIYPTVRKSVDYKQIVEDFKVDTSKYTKESTSWTVKAS